MISVAKNPVEVILHSVHYYGVFGASSAVIFSYQVEHYQQMNTKAISWLVMIYGKDMEIQEPLLSTFPGIIHRRTPALFHNSIARYMWIERKTRSSPFKPDKRKVLVLKFYLKL